MTNRNPGYDLFDKKRLKAELEHRAMERQTNELIWIVYALIAVAVGVFWDWALGAFIGLYAFFAYAMSSD